MTSNTAQHETEACPLVLKAADGYALAACFYPARGRALGNLIMAGATGVQQRFYRRFALHAAARGFNVLTLDYRGLGGSRPASLKGFQMDYLDWAHLDLAAAVEHLAEKDLPLYWVGHSFGGHAIGLLPDPGRLTACYSFGTGAGWSGWMSRGEALKVRLMWGLVLPALVAWKGYMAWSLLGLGDDLPKGVYTAWRRWCAFPRYFFDDPDMTHLADRYARVRMPCAFVTSVDDPWAPPRSRDAFASAYRNATLDVRDLQPQGRSIGHMGYFREGNEGLWDEALDWLLAHGLTQGVAADDDGRVRA